MSRLESSVERAVCAYAKKKGVRNKKLGGWGERGWPDRMFLYRGRVVFVEFKAEGKLPTPKQVLMLNALSDEGFGTSVVDNVEYGKGIIDWLVAIAEPKVVG